MEREKRLIDANALKQMFDEREADDVELYGGVHIVECFPADEAKEIVDKMPTVDAVEVIRCKNCKHRYTLSSGMSFCKKIFQMRAKDDDFCSYGERREGE